MDINTDSTQQPPPGLITAKIITSTNPLRLKLIEIIPRHMVRLALQINVLDTFPLLRVVCGGAWVQRFDHVWVHAHRSQHMAGTWRDDPMARAKACRPTLSQTKTLTWQNLPLADSKIQAQFVISWSEV